MSHRERPALGPQRRPGTNAETGLGGRISVWEGSPGPDGRQAPQAANPRDDAARRAGWVGAASDGGQGLRPPHPARVAPGHDYPILEAWNWGVEALAWCPRCERWHIHGAQRPDEPIHLQAHCHKVGGYSSYVLESQWPGPARDGRRLLPQAPDRARRMSRAAPAACARPLPDEAKEKTPHALLSS
jgi:hypothetical protein